MVERRGPKETWGVDGDKARRIKNLTDGSENPTGEWNAMTIECVGDQVKVWVNGDLVNHGTNCTASKGHIALQAEGSEVEFRRLELTPINKPRAKRMSQAESPTPRIARDIVYGHKDGLAMTMDGYFPDGAANCAAILFMVSGGWYSHWSPPERASPRFERYLSRGYAVFVVRHGSSPRYTIPEAVSDVRRAVRYVRKNAEALGVDADRLGVLGSSAGGHLALMLATTGDDGSPNREDPLQEVSSRVAAAVALVPPTDLRVAVWESPESKPAYRNFPALNLPMEQAERYSPLVHVTKDDAPALVLVGGEDQLVPAMHGEWIAEAYESVDVAHKLVVFPDAGHNLATPKNRERLISEVVNWFDRHLLPHPAK
jgi:acetyl esterase/lipase